MMDEKLIQALEPIEQEFDVYLMSEKEVQEFLASDLNFMEKAFAEEIDSAVKTKNELNGQDDISNAVGYIAGLQMGLQIARTWYDERIEEGF